MDLTWNYDAPSVDVVSRRGHVKVMSVWQTKSWRLWQDQSIQYVWLSAESQWSEVIDRTRLCWPHTGSLSLIHVPLSNLMQTHINPGDILASVCFGVTPSNLQYLTASITFLFVASVQCSFPPFLSNSLLNHVCLNQDTTRYALFPLLLVLCIIFQHLFSSDSIFVWKFLLLLFYHMV